MVRATDACRAYGTPGLSRAQELDDGSIHVTDDEQRPISVVVIDDDDDLRYLLRLALEANDRFDLVGDAGDGAAGLSAIEANRPDLVVLDLALPDVAGQELIPRIHAFSAGTRVVVFSGSASADADEIVGRHGAARYVTKGNVNQLLEVLDTVGRPSATTATKRFPPALESVRAARKYLEAHCTTWGCGQVTEIATLIVSELATNAVVHAGSAFDVTITRLPDVLRIDVSDESGDAPEPRLADEASEGGRGMLLVDALSNAWGIDPTETGKIVWAELPID